MKKATNLLLVLTMVLSFLTPLEAKEQKKTKIRNLASGLSYTLSTPPRDVWEDTDNKELTDGLFGSEDFTDPKWQGHHINDQEDKKRTITFDLGSKKSIKRIQSNYVHNPAAGVRLPKTVTYRVSNDKESWLELVKLQPKTPIASDFTSRETIYWDGERDGVFNTNNSGIYSRYVQIEFEIDSPWVFIDEVEILGHEGVAQDIFVEGEAEEFVESQEMPSVLPTINNLDNYALESDVVANTKLIKGDLKDLSLEQPLDSNKWIEFESSDEIELIIDLGEVKEIIDINFRTLSKDEFNHPQKIDIMVSENGDDWSSLYTLQDKFIENTSDHSLQKFIWDGRFDNFINSTPEIHKAKAALVKLIIYSDSPVAINNLAILGSEEFYGEAVSVVEDQDPELDVPETADYVRKTSTLGNINDIGLIYNHVNHEWKPEHLIPYIAYVDNDGVVQDRFFDTLLYLGLRTPGTPQESKTFDTNTQNPAGLEEWKWYLDRTFKDGGDLDALNEASRLVEEKLDDGYREKFFIMIPYPSTHLDSFGNLNGKNISFNPNITSDQESFENRKQAVEWYIDEVIHQLSLKDYEFLEFAGFYWVAENIESNIPYEQELVKSVSDKVHEDNHLFFWIPYFKASGFNKWEEYGFDFAIMQPNFYFNKYSKESRLEKTSLLARKYGMGVEIEFDERMLVNADDSEEKIEKFLEYLRLGKKFSFDGDVIRAYYQGGKTMYTMANSDNEQYRNLYDLLFEFIDHEDRSFVNIDKTPGETPSETPGETPSETPGETPSETPGETPSETPSEKPGSTPSETPSQTLPSTGKTSLLGLSVIVLISGVYVLVKRD